MSNLTTSMLGLAVLMTSSYGAHPAMPRQEAACPEAIDGEGRLGASVVIVGEVHGTAEIPLAFAGLVCRAALGGRTVLVGLEVPDAEQPAIDRVLGGKGEPDDLRQMLQGAFWNREFQDGRSSRAMVDLIATLRGFRAAGLDIRVLAVDTTTYRTNGDRDAHMAASLRRALAGLDRARAFVLVGNVHSRIISGYPWDPGAEYQPLGQLLRHAGLDVMALDGGISAGGTAWTCSSARPDSCGSREIGQAPAPGSAPRIEVFAEPRSGHDALLRLGPLTASPPAQRMSKMPGDARDDLN